MAHTKHISFAEIGSGEPIVVVGEKDAASAGSLFDHLATKNRVLTMDWPSAAQITDRDLPASIAHTLAESGVDRYSVIGLSSGVPIAIGLAILIPKLINRLILISPPPIATSDAALYEDLSKIEAPSMVMIGTRDRSGAMDTGRLLRGKIRSCHFAMIYDADRDVLSDRPQACLIPIREFLDRGEEFIVCHESQIISP
ncbi:MAG: alpha/beta hydrolase [Candidatus Binataceae bacterium]|nr:alpha/beta hydrolase [Candidatus Binataceae bacterium]